MADTHAGNAGSPEGTGNAGNAGLYSDHDRARWFPEEHSSRRSDFARDRARVLHSSALRRLAAKTQVLSPTAGVDFARNRLTHSLEVAQVGREFANALGLDPDVVDTACLAHDLGHPPFGHNGERALSQWASDIGGFEGNAQTLRVLTRIEPKVFAPDGKSFGLNLTRASLDASSKYPWPVDESIDDPSGRAKFGYYAEDAEVFAWLRDGSPDRVLCIEAQAMDLADDIAYSVHDFEDAIVGGFIDVRSLGDRVDHAELVDSMVEWIGGEHDTSELMQAFDRLDSMTAWLDEWEGTRRDHGKLKNLTSQLIGRFVGASVRATVGERAGEPLVRFGAHVVVPDDIRAEIAVLKGIVAAFVMSKNARQPMYTYQRELLLDLADTLLEREGRDLDSGFADDWVLAETFKGKKRAVVDQVASLTDQGAQAWHQRLVESRS